MTTPSPIRRTLSAISTHATTPQPFSLPRWVLYIAGVLVLLALVFGAVQQARIMRWDRLIRAAKERIISLEAGQAQAHYRGVSQATSRAVGLLESQDLSLQQKQQAMDQQRQTAQKKLEGMTHQQLLEEFRREGF